MAITVTPAASNSDGGDLDLEPDGPTAKTSLGHGYVRFSVPIPAHLLPAFHVAELRRLQHTGRSPRQTFADLRDNRLISRLQGLCLGLNFQGGTKRDMRRDGLV